MSGHAMRLEADIDGAGAVTVVGRLHGHAGNCGDGRGNGAARIGAARSRHVACGRSARARARGFTLVEVIVAFALLALGLTLLLGTLASATAHVRWADTAGRASLHAQSLIDQTGVGEPLEPGRSDGQFEDGRYRWALEVAPWRDPDQPPGSLLEPGAPQLLELQLDVAWGDGGPRERLQLRSLRLVRPSPTQGIALP